jgi:hypothetical protein
VFNKWQWQLPEPLKRLGERERDNLRADWQRIAPHDPKVRKRWVWAGVAVIAVLALLPAPHKADSSRPKEAEAPRSTTTSSWSPPSPYKVANGKLLACHDQAMYERFRNIAHDSEAYTRLGVVALLAGQCRLFQHGRACASKIVPAFSRALPALPRSATPGLAIGPIAIGLMIRRRHRARRDNKSTRKDK